MSIAIDRASADEADTLCLISELDAYLAGLYPPESNYGLSVEQLRQPNVSFYILRRDGEAAGCGAFVNVKGEYAEIKRMYVRPGSRGLKLGRRLLEFVEDCARLEGLPLARLETGPSQPEALALYERCGYVRRGPFGDYVDDPLSVFMEKALQR
ncbi:MAG TPA: GNAT family N-acetyltransferase [Albitalea sp.]|nr:GNAT family N-acetyltransferase [Albitalea sp.]